MRIEIEPNNADIHYTHLTEYLCGIAKSSRWSTLHVVFHYDHHGDGSGGGVASVHNVYVV